MFNVHTFGPEGSRNISQGIKPIVQRHVHIDIYHSIVYNTKICETTEMSSVWDQVK